MNGSAGDIARGVIDASLYMVLATADETGRPWSSPVYFAHAGHREFFWVSSPEAAHSRNIAMRAQVGIAIFDSRAAIGTGQGVYVSAVAEPIKGAKAKRAIDVFSHRSLAHGGAAWTLDDVGADAGLRLYRAVADGHWILAKDGRPDHRIAVALD
jgi:hypothetical protein